MKEQILDVIKGAVGVNLRYSSVLLNITKDYIKDVERVITQSSRQATTAPADQTSAPPTRRPPILLVGQANEEASGAFVLNNTASTGLDVSLAVEGDAEVREVNVTPTLLSIAPNASAVVRLKIKLTEKLVENRDYFGKVLAPGVSNQTIEFVVRRLPN
jgi:hypothetical protein